MRRIAEFDALRGIAATVIVIYHLRFLHSAPVLGSAVDLFFVLSGYLITTILLSTAKSPGHVRNFYARRALRIWPVYYLGFVWIALLWRWLPEPKSWAGLPEYLLYLQFVPKLWGGETRTFTELAAFTWTLAIEEQFYLIWPALVWWLGRRRLPLAIVPLIVLPAVLRCLGWPAMLLMTRCDGLALGALLAWLTSGDFEASPARRLRLKRGLLATAGGLLVYLGISTYLWNYQQVVRNPLQRGLDQFALDLGYFVIVGTVLLAAGGRRFGWLRNPLLVHAGQISYGLYFYHPFVIFGMSQVRKALEIKGSLWFDILRVALCFAVAEVSWRCLERPILRLKDRFVERPSAIPRPHFASPRVAAPEGSDLHTEVVR